MKKCLMVLLIASLVPIGARQQEAPVKLPIPSLIDGSPIGVNGKGVEFMMMLRRDIRRIQHGTVEHGKTKGSLLFHDEFHTLKSLIAIEPIHGKDAAFKACLHGAKAEFVAKMTPWLSYGKGIKKVMTLLITDYCKKTQKTESYLQAWGNLADGEEETFFETEMNTAYKFDLLLTDMVGFFEALISSCPKAVEQFTHDMRMKALRKTAEEVIKEEAKTNDYLQADYIQATILDVLVHHIERDLMVNVPAAQTVQPDKKELKKILDVLMVEDKTKMDEIAKIVLPLIVKKVTDAQEQEHIIWDVRKSLDSTNEPVQKDIIKRLIAKHIKEEAVAHQQK